MRSCDLQKTTKELTAFIQKTFRNAGFSRAVIALSGGVDSATSCALAVRALGPKNVYSLVLPYGSLDKQGVVDAQMVVKTLQIPKDNVSVVDIQSLVDPFLILDPAMDKIRRGNIMARTRMMVLYDTAKKRNALVVGTENISEHLLGYFTRFGDEASDIEPLRGLYKTQVVELARFVGIPEAILTKKPTAGLWDEQTDEGELGFSYKDADEILYLVYDEKKTMQEVVQRGFSSGVVDSVLARVKANDFKHHLPITPSEAHK